MRGVSVSFGGLTNTPSLRQGVRPKLSDEQKEDFKKVFKLMDGERQACAEEETHSGWHCMEWLSC
jgi:hypothetical protein